MATLPDDHHVFRHIKKTWMDGDFVDPAAFRLRMDFETGAVIEKGLSVNHVEHFKARSPRDAVPLIAKAFEAKKRKVGGESKFALLRLAAPSRRRPPSWRLRSSAIRSPTIRPMR
jgi:hypothetical protein